MAEAGAALVSDLELSEAGGVTVGAAGVVVASVLGAEGGGFVTAFVCGGVASVEAELSLRLQPARKSGRTKNEPSMRNEETEEEGFIVVP